VRFRAPLQLCVATGHLVWEALIAAEALEAQGISAEVIEAFTPSNHWMKKRF
jgi:transketolase C-terminal domain/subunit